MRIKAYPLILFILFCLVFQNTYAQEDLILGKWRPNLKLMKPIVEELFVTEKSNSDDKKLKAEQEMILEVLEGMMMEFRDDFTYLFTAQTQLELIETGTWTYEDGYMITQKDQTDKKDKVKVTEMSYEKLVIKPEFTSDNPIKEFIMKRAKP